jgi:pimeloyl-ACP methyl ester carboxylesterase
MAKRLLLSIVVLTLLIAGCGQPAATPTPTMAPPTATPMPTTTVTTLSAAGPSKEEIRFQSGHFELVGELRLPAGSGKHPAVAMVHGSGPATGASRFSDTAMIEIFQRNGYAVFAWDKPGSGQSTGELHPAHVVSQRAAILADAVQVLAEHPAIDATRIGLWGLSQAGWVMPWALELTDNVAFMIVVSGGAEDGIEQTAYQVAQRILSAGGSSEDAALVEQYGPQAGKATEYDEYLEAMEILVEIAPLHDYRDLEIKEEDEWEPLPPDDEGLFDPMEIIKRTTIPVLAFYGEQDWSIDPVQGAQAYEAALQAAGNPDYQIEFLSNVGHVFMTDPRYLEILEAWLQHLEQ